MCLFVSSFSQRIDNIKLDSAIIMADSLIKADKRVFFKNVESFIVWSDNKIKFEEYYNGFRRDSLHLIQSQTKSIVAILAGIAIDKGFIRGEESPVSEYFPEYFNADDKLKHVVKIKDLLTMSSGFLWEEMIPFDNPSNDNANMFRSGDWLKYALTRPMETDPGRTFKYNSGCPMIVAGIIEKATKMKLDDFAKQYLFEPLGIYEFSWIKDSTGFCHAGGGLSMLPYDVAKIGVLVMNKGKWNNVSVVSEEWISRLITPGFPTSFDIAEYGYFWWIRNHTIIDNKTARMISAEGAGGQKLYIFPEYSLVISFTERNYTTPQVSPLFIKESILTVLQ